jgi:hypothetical protein
MARASRRASYPLATGEYVGEESWNPALQLSTCDFVAARITDPQATEKIPSPPLGNDEFLPTNRPRRLDLVRRAHRPFLLRLRTERRRIDVGTNAQVVPVPMFSVHSRGHEAKQAARSFPSTFSECAQSRSEAISHPRQPHAFFRFGSRPARRLRCNPIRPSGTRPRRTFRRTCSIRESALPPRRRTRETPLQ